MISAYSDYFVAVYTNTAVEVVELTFGVIFESYKWSQLNHTLYSNVLEQREKRTGATFARKCNMWTMLIISKRRPRHPPF